MAALSYYFSFRVAFLLQNVALCRMWKCNNFSQENVGKLLLKYTHVLFQKTTFLTFTHLRTSSIACIIISY
jgi:hypothetical protein